MIEREVKWRNVYKERNDSGMNKSRRSDGDGDMHSTYEQSLLVVSTFRKVGSKTNPEVKCGNHTSKVN
uniref:Uncharacterized protein n=1 Tax=Parascaris univalens TaxID=6257 RepID=A0A915A1E8_PARUN